MRRSYGQRKEDNLDISIHAPREGCDGRRHCGAWASSNFNPRTPRGVRQGGGNSLRPLFLFQSTHPARGATPAALPSAQSTGNFNPRTPRGVRPLTICRHNQQGDFNPRTPRGVRRCVCWNSPLPHEFQSTHPARGATYSGKRTYAECSSNFNPRTPRGVRRPPLSGMCWSLCISIHAPREGCDIPRGTRKTEHRLFQSTHPARGATCATCKHWVMVDVFQSTHPARGATGAHLGRTLRRMISIHAPREGCDPAACPRSHSSSISIHAPREGCDQGIRSAKPMCDFNPRTPRGVRHEIDLTTARLHW